MVDRRINFGDPADAGTRYQIEDDANAAGGGNFVLAKDLDGGTVLLQYNPTSDAFEYVRAVDLGGEDVTGVGGVIGESGAGVYDDATTTVGDGTTSADHESVNTDGATVGIDPQRNLISTSTKSIEVGTDVDTIQEAFDVAAAIQHHRLIINLPDGTYAEDPVLTATVGGAHKNSGDTQPIIILGNQDNPGNVVLDSCVLDGNAGWVKIDGVQFTQDNPYTNENAVFEAYDSTHVTLQNVTFGGGTNGVISYNSNIELGKNVDFGTNNISGNGVQTKHGGLAWTQAAVTNPVSGNVGGWAFASLTGRINVHSNSDTLTGDSGTYRRSSNGIIYDTDTGTRVGSHPSALGFSKDSLPNITTYAQNDVSVGESATETIFDVGSNVGIIGGNIVGFNPTSVTVTWADGTTDVLSFGSRAEDDGGNRVRVIPLPALGPVQKLTFENGDTSSRVYGWTVRTFGQN